MIPLLRTFDLLNENNDEKILRLLHTINLKITSYKTSDATNGDAVCLGPYKGTIYHF